MLPVGLPTDSDSRQVKDIYEEIRELIRAFSSKWDIKWEFSEAGGELKYFYRFTREGRILQVLSEFKALVREQYDQDFTHEDDSLTECICRVNDVMECLDDIRSSIRKLLNYGSKDDADLETYAERLWLVKESLDWYGKFCDIWDPNYNTDDIRTLHEGAVLHHLADILSRILDDMDHLQTELKVRFLIIPGLLMHNFTWVFT